MVKKVRVSEGPHWWEQITTGTAPAAAVAAPEQQNTRLVPADWSLIAFLEVTVAPGHRGMSEAGVPEVSLPTHGRRGGAAMGDSRRRRRGPMPFLTVVAALAFMILVPWLAFRGYIFLDAISERVYGWMEMCFIGWMWLSGWMYVMEWLGE